MKRAPCIGRLFEELGTGCRDLLGAATVERAPYQPCSLRELWPVGCVVEDRRGLRGVLCDWATPTKVFVAYVSAMPVQLYSLSEIVFVRPKL